MNYIKRIMALFVGTVQMPEKKKALSWKEYKHTWLLENENNLCKKKNLTK